MTLITAAQLAQFAPHSIVPAADLDAAATEFDISTPLRLQHWLGQCHVESEGFSRLEENLNYSAERLSKVWPKRFPSSIAAAPYEHNPQKLAERVYGGRESLGNNQDGDGWRFRGRGVGQVTGRANYARVGLLIGVELVSNPDELATPAIAARASAAFWADHKLNALADRDDVPGITQVINGALTALSDRAAQVARAKTIWR